MEVLQLVFLYEGSDGRLDLGFFNSLPSVYSAMTELSNKPGFCDYPNGFLIIPRYVHAQNERIDKIYVAYTQFFPHKYEGGNYTEYDTYLGLYENKEEAEKALARYLKLNPEVIPGMDRMCDVAEVSIGKITGMEDGFTSG